MITRTTLPYFHDDIRLEGTFIRDNALPGPLPGIMLIHEFMGPGEYMIPHAERLARHGYDTLLCDMYGSRIRPKDKDEASRQARIYRQDRLLMRSRARAGLHVLKNHPEVDEARLFSLGFSFGGCASLELARSGENLSKAISFYGNLNTPLPSGPGEVKAGILVLHGAQDKIVAMDEIPVFEDEMHKAGADFQMVIFDDAGHGFANSTIAKDPQT